MALIMKWEKTKAWKERKQDPQNAYDAGIMLMELGMSEITEKNLSELKLRKRIHEAMFGHDIYPWDLDALVGVEANTTPLIFSRWMEKNYLNWKDGQK